MSAEELKNKGNQAFTKGNYAEAQKHFTDAIGLDPNNHVLYSNRSGAFAATKNYELALEDAEKTVELKPDWPKGYSRKGAALHGLEKYDEAITAYKQGLQLDAGNAQLKQALEEVQRAKATDPKSLNDMFKDLFGPNVFEKIRINPVTEPFLQQTDYVAMIQDLQKSTENLDKYMKDKRIVQTIGVLMGFPVKFASDMKEATSMETDIPKKSESKQESEPGPKPKQPEPEPTPMETEGDEKKKKAEEEKNKGNEAYKQKNFETAVKHYTNAIQMDPDNIVYLTNRAAATFEMGKYDECIEDCNKAIEEGRSQRYDYKQIAKAYARMGNAYLKQDKLEEACNAYEKSLTEDRTPQTLAALQKAEKIRDERKKQQYLDPQKSLEAKERGNKLFQDGKYPEAIKEYTEAILRNPNDHVLFSNRAASYLKLTEYPMALKDATECLRLKPDFAKGYTRKGHAHYFMKEYEKALEAYETGLKIEPNNVELTEGQNRAIAQLNATATSGDEKEVLERAMRNPEVQQILSDPVMQKILQDMQNDPKAAQDHLKSPLVRDKIEKLIAAGVLRVGQR